MTIRGVIIEAARRQPLRVRLAALSIAAVLVVAGCAARPHATAAPARHSVTFSGAGSMSTASVHLAGDYFMAWTAQAATNAGCYHAAALKQADGGLSNLPFVAVTVDNASPRAGATGTLTLDPADYYVWSSSGCAWTVTLTPE
jgi:hypothetical protein